MCVYAQTISSPKHMVLEMVLYFILPCERAWKRRKKRTIQANIAHSIYWKRLMLPYAVYRKKIGRSSLIMVVNIKRDTESHITGSKDTKSKIR